MLFRSQLLWQNVVQLNLRIEHIKFCIFLKVSQVGKKSVLLSKVCFTDMKPLSFFSYHHREITSLLIWSSRVCGFSLCRDVKIFYRTNISVVGIWGFYNTRKVFWTVRTFTAPPKLHQMGISRVLRTFTDFCQLSISYSRKMFCYWFQTLIILWKAALGQRLNSLKARVKSVVVIKNSRTTRALPTYQSFVVKARSTHVEFVHHLNGAQKLLMTMQFILVLLQVPFSAVAFH